MTVIDVNHLLEPISADSPCGPNLEDNVEFSELDRAATGKPEQQYGDTIIPAEDPDWKEVKRVALALLERTRDLRVGVELTRALLSTNGWIGLSEGLEVIQGWIDRYWETVHPQLDAEDNNDPTQRINSLAPLNDLSTTVRIVRVTPLVRARGLGEYSLRDIGMARGEIPPGSAAVPDMSAIEAAFSACDLEALRADAAAVGAASDHIKAIEGAVLDRVGGMQACNLDEVRKVLYQAKKILDEHCAKRQPAEEPTEDIEAPVAEADEAAPSLQSAPAAASRGVLDIRSREDVVRAIEKICEYYDRHEPSSPVPMLLLRAKRLATKSFLEIIQDLTPDALAQARSIGGVDADEQTGY